MQQFGRKFMTLDALQLVLYTCACAVGVVGQRGSENPCDTGSSSSSSLVLRIGGMFSDQATSEYFKQAVSRVNHAKNRILPDGVCLASSAVELGYQGTLQQMKTICSQLMPEQVHALVLGQLSGSRSDLNSVPSTPAFISSYYHLPLLSAIGQVDETVPEQEIHGTVLRLLPHKAHEVEAWCALLSHFSLTHAIMITSSDAVGSEYEARMRHCWWRGNVIRYVQFLHFSPKARRADVAQLVESVRRIDYHVVLLYAEADRAALIFEEAAALNISGHSWIWIVSQYATAARNVPVGALTTGYVKPAQFLLIDEAVTLAAFTFARLLNSSWDEAKVRRILPPTACIRAEDNIKWAEEGKKIVSHLRQAFYLNSSRHSAVSFDTLGYRMLNAYDIGNVREDGEHRIVGRFDENSVFFDDDWMASQNQLQVHDGRLGNSTWSHTDIGLFTTVNTSVEINYAMHSRESFSVNSVLSLAEAMRTKVQQRSMESETPDYNKLRKSLQINESEIIWPGGGPLTTPQFVSRWHLRVVTIESVPFVYKFKRPQNYSMLFVDQYGNPEHHSDTHEHATETETDTGQNEKPRSTQTGDFKCPGLRCTHISPNSSQEQDYCCFGYCIDLLIKLSTVLNITFDLHLVGDGSFGHLIDLTKEADASRGDGQVRSVNSRDRDTKKMERWTGMVGELDEDTADMIVAPLSMISHRNRAIDFTKPFMYPTLSILTRKAMLQQPALGSFLQPFETGLWLVLFLVVNAVAGIMYFLERFSPFAWFRYDSLDDVASRYNGKMRKTSAVIVESLKTFRQCRRKQESEKDRQDRPITLAEAAWLSWGIVLSTGAGEKLPHSSSSRTFTIIWACFAMIVVASYTANLAAFLVLDRHDDTIQGIDDPRLRNPSNLFTFATIRNSDVELYFKRNVELTTMYRFMQSYVFDEVEAAVDAVRNGSLDAFIWETSRLIYETMLDCRLTLASGGSFGKGQYAIALRKQLKQFVFYDWRTKAMENVSEISSSGKADTASAKHPALVDKLSMEILQMRDSGFMENLDEKWVQSSLEDLKMDELIIKTFKAAKKHSSGGVQEDEHCPPESPSPTLGLANIVDIFTLLCCGTACAAITLVFELLYYRCKRQP